MMNYLQLIKYKNLALLAFLQVILRYGFLKPQNVWQSLNTFQFALLVIATISIAGGYYVINALFEDSNEFSSLNISETNAYYVYAFLSIIGVVIGMYLSNVIQKPGFIALFILTVALGYFQATTIKDIFILGWLIQPLLFSFSFLIIAIFDLFPATYDQNREVMTLLFSILKDYAFFAFVIQLVREIIKETEQSILHTSSSNASLVKYLGVQKTNYCIAALLIAPSIYLIYYILVYLLASNLFLSVLFVSVAVIAPMLIGGIKIINASESKDYKQVRLLLKYVLILGVLSIAIITYNIQHNV
jgi:hypothetical protein